MPETHHFDVRTVYRCNDSVGDPRHRRLPSYTLLTGTYRNLIPYFLKRSITQTVYTVCTRINYKIVPVTNLNKYLHYGTSGTE